MAEGGLPSSHRNDAQARWDDLEARQRELESFLAEAVHEIRQPLTALRNDTAVCQMCLERLTPAEPAGAAVSRSQLAEVAASLDHAERALDRIEALVGRLEGYLRTRSLPLEVRPLHRLLGRAAGRVAADLQRSGVALEIEPVAEDLFVRVQPGQLTLALENLLRNALEAYGPAAPDTEPGGGADRFRGRIEVRVSRSDGIIRVSVGNDGPPIPADARPRIFDRFFTTKAGGMGLGLWLCRSIVDRHGGRIWLDPDSTERTVFHLELPVEPRSEAEETP